MVKARSMRMARIASFSLRSMVWSLDEQEVLGHLLGDGRGADHAPSRLHGAQIGDDGAQDALNVEAAMLIEILVLGRDEGLDHAVGNGGDRHVDAPLARELGDQPAVIGVDAGHHRRLVFGEHLVVRQFARHLPQDEGRGAGDGDEDDHAGGEHEAEEAQEEPPRRRRRRCSGGLTGAVMSMVRPVLSPVLVAAGRRGNPSQNYGNETGVG